jgi:UDP-glucose 4-epimerase
LGWKIEVVDNFSSGKVENLSDLNVRHITSFMLPAWDQLGRQDDKPLVIHSDMEDPNVLDRIQKGSYDVIFLMAANPRVEESVKDPVNTTDNNCTRSLQIFKAVENANKNIRLVFSSSSAVYGNEVQVPTSENQKRTPASPYGLQKLFIEEYARISNQLHGTDVVCLRYFNVYGPYQYGDSAYATAVSAWCHSISNQEPLRSDGTGEQSRDMIFVNDVVDANILAATRFEPFKGECINIGTGSSIANNQILEILRNQFPNLTIKKAPVRKGDVFETKADVFLAKKELGFESFTSFEQGLRKTLIWWNLLEDTENEE